MKIMKTAFLLLLTFNLHAQQFQGMATYESKTSSAELKERLKSNKEMTPEIQKRIEERMKSFFEKTFVLNFDKSASIYKEEEKLQLNGDNNGRMGMMRSMMGVSGTYYKNIKQKTYTEDKEFMGKDFLVNDSLPKFKWKMESETRIIGGYNCFKATATLTVSELDMNVMRPRREDDAKDKKSNLLDNIFVTKEALITAWYTPEIAVNQGPDKYWGLPGLILEINDGKTVILCSKIVLNPKEKVMIQASTKGKLVSQKEYDETVIKKTKEFIESNQRSGSAPGRSSGSFGR